jgi:hypothetical protein
VEGVKMTNKNCVSKTIEISIERFSQLVACEATLVNVKKVVIDGRYSMKPEELITSLKYILQDPETNE